MDVVIGIALPSTYGAVTAKLASNRPSAPRCCSASRRLALLQLGGIVMPQAQKVFVEMGSKLARADESSGTFGDIAQAATVTADVAAQEEDALQWAKNDNRKLLHVVYCVGDLDKTIKFYTECLGMKLLRRRNIPSEKYANAFLGYGHEETNFAIELTYNYGVDKYDIGTGFGHIGIAVDNIAKVVDLISTKGGKVTRKAGPVNGDDTFTACIEDPNGYPFELLERRTPSPEPLCQVMLRVRDLDRSIKYYENAFGMKLLRKRDYPDYKYTTAAMGYGDEDKNAVLELTYNYGVKEYDKGNGYAQIAIGTDDVYKTAQAIKQSGGKITREPAPVPGINTKITACEDPDGWRLVFVDNIDFAKERA